MTRWRERLSPLRALGLVVGATLVLLLLVAQLPAVVEQPVGPVGRAQPLAGASPVCPLLGGDRESTDTVFALAIPGVPRGPVLPDSGYVEVRALAGEANVPRSDLTVRRRGVPGLATIDAGSEQGYQATARGPLAPGLAVEQGRLAAGTQTFGLADVGCAEAGRDFWFVGGTSVTGSRTRLVLANPSSSPALVDVTTYDESGEVATPALEGMTVRPQEATAIRLDALATGSDRLAFRVRVTEGAVLAGAELRLVSGLDPLGLTWLPPVSTPQGTVVVPGVPATGQRRLQVLNPGEQDAVVSFRVLGAGGAFTAAEIAPITVLAGAVGEVDLDPLREPAAIEVSADTPVTAAAVVAEPAPSGGLPDIAVTPAAPPLAGPAGTALRSRGDLATSLALTAEQAAAEVRVQVLSGGGLVLSDVRRDVAATSTLLLPVGVPRAADGPYAVVVTPVGAAPVHVTRVVRGTADAPTPLGDGTRRGAVLDLLPLVAAPVAVDVPAVGQDLSAAVPAP